MSKTNSHIFTALVRVELLGPQIISSELRELGRNVNLTQHFGFLTNWNLVGPFHNKDRAGFGEVFGPEKDFDLNTEYKGIDGSI